MSGSRLPRNVRLAPCTSRIFVIASSRLLLCILRDRGSSVPALSAHSSRDCPPRLVAKHPPQEGRNLSLGGSPHAHLHRCSRDRHSRRHTSHRNGAGRLIV